jgi:hypothetical protein
MLQITQILQGIGGAACKRQNQAGGSLAPNIASGVVIAAGRMTAAANAEWPSAYQVTHGHRRAVQDVATRWSSSRLIE